MLPKAFNIGPLTFHLYGLIIALAIYVGYLLAQKRAHLHKIPQKLFEDPILLLPLVLSIIGARIYHVLDYWEIYSKNPQTILNITSGGLGIWGALAGIFIGFWIIAKARKISLISMLDLLAPSLLLGQAIGRFGNYVNQEAFGPPTNLPWGVFITPENRPLQFINSTHFHPTFFYEAILDFIFFLLLICLANRSFPSSLLSFPPASQAKRGERKRESTPGSRFSIKSRMTIDKPGRTFALYLIFYSIGRFAVEFFRTDTATVGTIKVAQVLAVIAFATGLFLLKKLNVHKNK